MAAGAADDILKRVPPQNIEAEQSVLGAILLDNEAINQAIAETGWTRSRVEQLAAALSKTGVILRAGDLLIDSLAVRELEEKLPRLVAAVGRQRPGGQPGA